MNDKKYFNLISEDLKKLSIEKDDYFNCVIKNKEENSIYDGFILAKSPTESAITTCEINFQKSSTDKKYQPRIIFRRTDKDFNEKKVAGESIKQRISFHTGGEGYREFWKMISFLYKWREIIDLGEFENYFSITDKNLNDVLQKISNNENSEIVLKNLQKLAEKDLENIGNLVNTVKIRNIIKQWAENKTNFSEEFWQKVFQNNSWVLSQLFACPYLKVGEKTYCGGKEDDNKGGVQSDLQYKNILTGSIAFVEIKTPKNDIIIGQKYRGEAGKENIIYSMDAEITGGVNQVLNQKKVYLKTHGEKDGKNLNNTKCILVIGIVPVDNDQKKSFEIYRNSLRDVEIITFDELFERIEMILKIFEK